MCSEKEIEIDPEKMKEGISNLEEGLDSLDKAMGSCGDNDEKK